MTRRPTCLAIVAAVMVVSCVAPAPSLDDSTELGPADRRALLVRPSAFDGTTPLPVVVMLHGLGGDARSQDRWFRMSEVTRERGAYLLIPNGSIGRERARFWNATDACCDFDRSGVDDVAYVRGLLDELAELVPVDESRIYVVGHSNGGFMSYRLACELADRVTAIATLAGSDYADPSACVPSRPVSVLHIHGTADTTVRYEGGRIEGMGDYPGARAVAARWAERGGCASLDDAVAGPARDLDGFFAGDESEVLAAADCDEGTSVELWTIRGGGHLPTLAPGFASQVLEWLLAQDR